MQEIKYRVINLFERGNILYLIRVLLHFMGAVVGGFIVGMLPEFLLGSVYHNTIIEPYSPFVAGSAAVVGYATTRKLHDSAARMVWIAGSIWLLWGMLALATSWDATWSHSSRIDYVLDNLLNNNCGATECLNELLYTTPWACSLAYSLAAGASIRNQREASTRD